MLPLLTRTCAGYRVRADAESIGFCETFRVYCQARFKRRIKTTKKEVIDATGIELDNMYVVYAICFSNAMFLTICLLCAQEKVSVMGR